MWLCCMPLWHFVTTQVAPFERAQLSAKHDQTKPVWWGIDGISRAVECVKKTKWFVVFLILGDIFLDLQINIHAFHMY